MNGPHSLTGHGICILLALACSGFAQTVESVTAQKDRCLRKREKIERSIDKTITDIERIKRLRRVSSESEAPRVDAFIEKTQNKIEYFNNRIERTRNQLEKIEVDLQKAGTGNQCPKCIASDVNLFCRHIESLSTEHTDLANAVNEFERCLRKSASVGDLIKRTDQVIAGADSSSGKGTSRYAAAIKLQEKARSALASNNLDAAMNYALEAVDSASALSIKPAGDCPLSAAIQQAARRIEEARQTVEGGGAGTKAATILEKAVSHLEKGRNLCAKGRSADARTELAIAEKFAATAIDCSARKE